MPLQKNKVLFLCTGNSCRSQMAEGLVKHYLRSSVECGSAGLSPSFVHPKAIQVMREIGIDILAQRSKSLEEFEGESFDLSITLCDEARAACPVFPGAARQRHYNFMDPAAAKGSEEEILQVFRKVRDEIKKKVLEEWTDLLRKT